MFIEDEGAYKLDKIYETSGGTFLLSQSSQLLQFCFVTIQVYTATLIQETLT